MLKKEHLNRNLVIFLYSTILLNVIIYLIAVNTSFGYVLYISSILVLLNLIMTIVAIGYNGYAMLKNINKRSITYFALSVLSTTWIVVALFYASSLLTNF